MDSRNSERSRPSRAMSPTFRTGPRQKPLDPNADEIIRFVREFQGSDSHSQIQGAAGLKRRAVLPAIGRYSNNVNNDVINFCPPSDANDGVILTGATEDIFAATQIVNTSVNVSTADSGFVDKTSEAADSNSDDNEDSNYNNKFYGNDNPDGDEFDSEISSVETRVDPFGYKCGVVDIRKESYADMHEMRPVNRRSLVAEDQLISSRSRRPSKIVDKLLHSSGSSSSSINQNYTTPRRFSHGGPSKGGQLLRPRALPQLPPISRSVIPARPSAPSPSLTPPSPQSAAGTDDEDGNPFDDDCIDNERPEDYIDCH